MDYQFLTNSDVTISTFLIHIEPPKYLVIKSLPIGKILGGTNFFDRALGGTGIFLACGQGGPEIFSHYTMKGRIKTFFGMFHNHKWKAKHAAVHLACG